MTDRPRPPIPTALAFTLVLAVASSGVWVPAVFGLVGLLWGGAS
jgi:hypothetical protein